MASTSDLLSLGVWYLLYAFLIRVRDLKIVLLDLMQLLTSHRVPWFTATASSFTHYTRYLGLS